MEPATFSTVTAIAEQDRGLFTGDVHPGWTIADKPNGGYLLSMLARAAGSVAAHPHPIAASAHYLRSPDPGPVEIEVEILRSGRSASQVRTRMRQDGAACIEALLTVSELEPDTKPYWGDGVPDSDGPDGEGSAFEDAVRLPGVNPAGVPVAIMDQVDLRVDPSSLGFGRGRPSGRGELRGWLALPDGEAFDPHSLVYAVDAFPPATFDIELTGWVPTLELTTYVRALPAPGPVRVLQRAHLIDAQRVDEACWVWDSTGRLVAHGTQLAGIRLG